MISIINMTKKLNTSQELGSFRKNNRIKQLMEEGKNPDEDDYLNSILSCEQQKIERENDEKWQKNNLEYDLRSTDWIIDKVKKSDTYAQNLYAALCNNEFIQPDNTWDILKEEYWGCSWRYAGGIISDIQEQGDYIDWYCSGLRSDPEFANGFVSESVITDEIKKDLKKLGWVVIPNKDNDSL